MQQKKKGCVMMGLRPTTIVVFFTCWGVTLPDASDTGCIQNAQKDGERCRKMAPGTKEHMPLPGSPILITGISGMIGSYLAHYLVEHNVTPIYGLVRWRTNLRNLNGILPKISLEYGDVTDAFRMEDIIRSTRPRYIYHYAAQAINNVGAESPSYTLQANVLGTLNVLEGVKRAHLANYTRVLIAGSSAVYGEIEKTWDGPLPETAPVKPGSTYGVSKLSAEHLGNQYVVAEKLQVITVRIFNHVAPGGTTLLALQNFCSQIAMAELGYESVIRHGNLDTFRDVTDVRDSIKVHASVVVVGTPGEVYNIGSGQKWSTGDLLNIAVQQAQVPIKLESEKSRWRHFDEKSLLADNSKIRKLLGWNPTPNMNRTITDILNFWRAEMKALYGPRK